MLNFAKQAKIIPFVFLLLLVSCNITETSIQGKLFDELSIGLLEAWSEATSKHQVPEFRLTVGDTFTVYSEVRLIKHLEDSLYTFDCEDCYIELSPNTTLKITEISPFIVNLETVNLIAGKIEGYYLKDHLMELIDPYSHVKRKELFDDLYKKRTNLINNLTAKYGLTEGEFYRAVGEEYCLRTGNREFSF
jgi:hypothetical protein